MMKFIIYALGLSFLVGTVYGQAGAGMKIANNQKHYLDSIQRVGYPYRFPIWGRKAVYKGFDIQYPVGVMLNLNTGRQDVTINNLEVGFNGNGLVPMDFIKFGKVRTTMQGLTSRIDLWLLPFLDLYAIVGLVHAKTNVSIVSPFQFTSEAKFKGNTFGLGTTIAGGYHGIVTITDINYTWTHLDKLDEPVKALMVTPRLGYNYSFKKHRERAITCWIGTTGFYVNKGTVGSISLSDLGPNMSQEQIDKILSEGEAWYQALDPGQKLVVKEITKAIKDKIDGLPNDLQVDYSLEKNPTSHWSMLVGMQYQFNKRWQVRSELGFLGGRSSFLLSGNYRWRW